MLKRPDECANLAEIRAAIDALDRQVIALLGQRADYVLAAATFKTGEVSVQALERQQTMLEERRAWAAESGLDPDLVESLFRQLIAYFVAHEMERWRAESG